MANERFLSGPQAAKARLQLVAREENADRGQAQGGLAHRRRGAAARRRRLNIAFAAGFDTWQDSYSPKLVAMTIQSNACSAAMWAPVT